MDRTHCTDGETEAHGSEVLWGGLQSEWEVGWDSQSGILDPLGPRPALALWSLLPAMGGGAGVESAQTNHPPTPPALQPEPPSRALSILPVPTCLVTQAHIRLSLKTELQISKILFQPKI